MRKFYEMQPEYADVIDLRLPVFTGIFYFVSSDSISLWRNGRNF